MQHKACDTQQFLIACETQQAIHSMQSDRVTICMLCNACSTQLASTVSNTQLTTHSLCQTASNTHSGITNPAQHSMPQMASMLDNPWVLLVCASIEGARFLNRNWITTQPATTAYTSHCATQGLQHKAISHCMRDTACNTQHAIRSCNNMHAMQCMQHTACHHSKQHTAYNT